MEHTWDIIIMALGIDWFSMFAGMPSITGWILDRLGV